MVSDNFLVILLVVALIYFLILQLTKKDLTENNINVHLVYQCDVCGVFTPPSEIDISGGLGCGCGGTRRLLDYRNVRKIPQEIVMANRRYSNFIPPNLNDSYGWGDASFGSAGGGSNSNVVKLKNSNTIHYSGSFDGLNDEWQPPFPSWYGW